jgi:SNF2 family DNA or RNA helicase
VDYVTPPYEWQKKLLQLSIEQPNIAVLADMGTGKTKGVIDCLRYKYAHNRGLKRTLIVSPLVTLFNWKNEFKKHSRIPEHQICVLHGSTDKKMKQFENARASIYITNYESFISPKIAEMIHEWAPEILILDESQRVKSHKAKRSKTIHKIRQSASNVFEMSGTPMTNGPEDIFMQYLILDNGETFGKNFYVFQRTYMYDANAGWSHLHTHFPDWKPREEMLPVLQEKIYRKAIRVTKDECLDLPELEREVYPVELSAAQRKYYKAMEDDYVTFIEEANKKGIAVATTALTKALRLQQIVTGFAKLDDGTEIEIEDNPRLEALEELISDLHVNHKVIVWCSFINNYKQIGRMLAKMGIKHTFITGEETLEEKNGAMNEFNSDHSTRVVVCNRRAAGLGINLVAASYAITYSRNFSLEDELQSTDRNYRGGSEIHERIVKIDLCAKDTVDEDVTMNLAGKKEVSDKVIETSIRNRR